MEVARDPLLAGQVYKIGQAIYINNGIIPEVKLEPEAKPSDTNGRVVYNISQVIVNDVR